MNQGHTTQAIDWHVCFNEGDRPSWMDRWQKPGFHHVYAARWDGAQWIVFQPNLATFEIRAVRLLQSHHKARILKGKSVYVTAAPPTTRNRVPWFLGPVTCVEFVKHLLGIRAWWILTPWQLYRYLESGKYLEERNGKWWRRRRSNP